MQFGVISTTCTYRHHIAVRIMILPLQIQKLLGTFGQKVNQVFH